MYALKLSSKGWHGVIADTFTFKNLNLIASVFAQYLKEQGYESVVIAFDRRFNHHIFARHLAEQLSSQHLRVVLGKTPVSSSVLRLAIRDLKSGAGIMLSAAQLPEAYGGLQIYDASAQLLARPVYQQLDAQIQTLDKDIGPLNSSEDIELIDLQANYFSALKTFLDLNVLRQIKGKIIHNALAGSLEGWLKQFVLETGLQLVVQELKTRAKGDDHLHDFSPQALDSDLLFHLNTNSDGSKLCLRLAGGEQLNRHQVSHIILDYLHKQETERGYGFFERLGKQNKLLWLDSDDGFKATIDALLSGDIISEDKQLSLARIWQLNVLKEDALATILMLLQIQATEDQPVHTLLNHNEDTDWRKSFGVDRIKLKTKRLPRRFLGAIPDVLADHKVIKIAKDEHVRLTFEGKSWLEFRLDKQGEKSALLLRCQAETSRDVKNLLSAAKVLVHTITRV